MIATILAAAITCHGSFPISHCIEKRIALTLYPETNVFNLEMTEDYTRGCWSLLEAPKTHVGKYVNLFGTEVLLKIFGEGNVGILSGLEEGQQTLRLSRENEIVDMDCQEVPKGPKGT